MVEVCEQGEASDFRTLPIGPVSAHVVLVAYIVGRFSGLVLTSRVLIKLRFVFLRVSVEQQRGANPETTESQRLQN